MINLIIEPKTPKKVANKMVRESILALGKEVYNGVLACDKVDTTLKTKTNCAICTYYAKTIVEEALSTATEENIYNSNKNSAVELEFSASDDDVLYITSFVKDKSDNDYNQLNSDATELYFNLSAQQTYPIL